MGNVLECAADPLADLEDSSSANQPRVLQPSTRLGESYLWDLQRDFYADVGERAWTEGIVPYFVSNNAFIAKSYSTIILEFLNDWFRDGNGDADSSEPIYVVEFGAGIGKLGYLVIKELLNARDFFPQTCGERIPFRYVLTDCAQKTIDFWHNHPQLQPLFELGVLDTALVDANVPGLGGEIRLNKSGVVISSGSKTKNPIFGICNYVFNSLKHDAFQVRQDGRLYVASVAVRTHTPEPLRSEDGVEDVEVPPLKAHEIIQGLDCEWKYTAVPTQKKQVSPLFGNNNMLNAIPETYRMLAKERSHMISHKAQDTKSAKLSTSFTVPVGGITLMQAVSRMSAGRRLVMLVGDKGYTRISEMRGLKLKDPHLARHGSFSAMVNFHALQLFVDQIANMSGSSTKSFMRLSPFEEGFKTALIGLGFEKNDVPLTSWAFHENATSNGPDQLSSLQRAESEQKATATIQRALGLLRLCNYDSEVFMKFKHMFISAVGDPDTSQALRKDLSRLTKLILDRHYHLHSTKDIWFELGRVNMGLADYHKAHMLFETSNEKCGTHHVTHHNIGICRYFIGHFDQAMVAFDASLSMSSEYAEAIKWKKKLEDKMVEEKASKISRVDC